MEESRAVDEECGRVRIGSWQGVTQLAGALIFALGLVPPKAAAPASFCAGAAGVTAPKGSHGAAGQDPS